MLKSFIGPLALTFAIALFVFLMQFVFLYIDDLIGKGLAFFIIAKMILFVTLTFIPLALPLAILLASIMTFGNLAENQELACMKAAGLSLPKIMSPLIVLITLISIGAFVFANNVMPWINLKKDALLYDIRIAKPALNIQQESFYNGIEGYSIRIGKKDPDQETIHNVMIYDHSDPDNTHQEGGDFKIILAKWGKMKMSADQRYLVLNLFDGNAYQEMVDNASYRMTHPLTINNFKEQTIYFDLSNFRFSRTNEDFFKSHTEMLNIKQLKITADSMTGVFAQTKAQFYTDFNRAYFDTLHLDKSRLSGTSNLPEQVKINVIEAAINNARNALQFVQGNTDSQKTISDDIIKRRIEIHKKFTFAAACFLLFFIGAPFGAIIRKGGLGMPVVVSSIIFILFYILTIIGIKSAAQEVMTVQTGLWLPSAVLLPLGAFFTYKASLDSALFEQEAYVRFFTKLFRQRKP